MISLQMVGEFGFTEFASSVRESRTMIDSAIQFLKKRGYQVRRESSDEWVGFSRSGEATRILIGKTTPAGVR